MNKKFLIASAICLAGVFQVASSQTSGETGKTKLEQNKAIVRGYMLNQALSKGDPAALETYFSEDVVFNNSRDIKQQLARMRAVRGAFPDLHLTIEDQIAEGDRVVTRVTFRGTHQGEFNGIAPTGKQIEYSGIAIDRITNGKVVEMWHVSNQAGVLQQVGAASTPAPKK